MPRIDLREAEMERQDHEATFCRTCTAPAEEGSPHCLHCGMYWADCDAGLWDDNFNSYLEED